MKSPPWTCLGDLPGDLLNLNDNEFGGIERCKAHQDVYDAEIDAGLGIIFAIAFDEVGLLRRGPLKRSLQEQALQERSDIEADLAPQRNVVGLEDHPLGSLIEARLDVKRQSANGDVLPLGASLIVALKRACSPDDVAKSLELAQTINRLNIEIAVLEVGEIVLQPRGSGETSLNTGGGLPDTAIGVGRRIDTGDETAGRIEAGAVAEQRVGCLHPGEIVGGVVSVGPGN